jgi:exosortase A-associated hydrolase 2
VDKALSDRDAHLEESPLFFPVDGVRLYGVYHQPAHTAKRPAKKPYVICHPFAEEKLWAHRVLVTFARRLAERGHPVLRFDYLGNGDSEGDFAGSSLDTCLAGASAGVDLLRHRSGCATVGVLGLRFGASVACLLAERRTDVAEVVMWAPIVDGARYMQELLRTNLATQMAVFREIRVDRAMLTEQLQSGGTANVDGYEISRPMYEQLSQMNLAAGGKTFVGRSLILQIDRTSGARPLPELEALRARYPRAELRVVQEPPFWKEIELFYETAPNLFAAVFDWLAADEAINDSTSRPTA